MTLQYLFALFTCDQVYALYMYTCKWSFSTCVHCLPVIRCMHSVDQHHHVAAHVDGGYTQNQVEPLLVETELADPDQDVVKLHGWWMKPVDHI